jgi:hypothetical protein
MIKLQDIPDVEFDKVPTGYKAVPIMDGEVRLFFVEGIMDFNGKVIGWIKKPALPF